MEPGSVNLYAEILKTAGMLGIVLGIMLGILFLFKRYFTPGISGADKSKIRLISSFFLGNKEKIAIVEVENKRLLLGITSNNISLLTELDNTDDTGGKEVREKKDFGELLKNSLKKGGLFSGRGKKVEVKAEDHE